MGRQRVRPAARGGARDKDGVMDGLELGHALITMIEPDRETLEEYNLWYERDHFLSGVLTGPAAFAGQRFVATRDLKAVRQPKDSLVATPVVDGSFITLYWIEKDRLTDHTDWAFPEAARLAGLGRMDTRRHHVSTAYYDLVSAVVRDGHPVSPELAIHRQYPGFVGVWADRGAVDAGELVGGPVAQVVTFAPATLPEPLPAMPGAVMAEPDRDVVFHACFVDELSDDWPHVPDVDALLVAPFIPTIPGTTAHYDELW
jgi:hypothetical protein